MNRPPRDSDSGFVPLYHVALKGKPRSMLARGQGQEIENMAAENDKLTNKFGNITIDGYEGAKGTYRYRQTTRCANTMLASLRECNRFNNWATFPAFGLGIER